MTEKDEFEVQEIGSQTQTDYTQEYTPHTISSILAQAQKSENTKMAPVVSGYGGTDYLFVDEHKQKGERGWNEKMCYNTGTAYGAGLAVGGIWGVYDGLRADGKSALGAQSAKIRVNALLNSVTRRGPMLGNSAGVLAIMFTCNEHLLSRVMDSGVVTGAVAGALTGAMFKSTAGVVQAMRAGGSLGVLAALGSLAMKVVR